MKSLTTMFAAVALACCLAPAAHAQRTINDCEKIQAADAYNQCLAKFGPPAKTLNMESARPGDVKSGSEDAAAGAGAGAGASAGPAKQAARATVRRHGRGRVYVRRGRGGGGRVARVGRSGGRKRMTISVGR